MEEVHFMRVEPPAYKFYVPYIFMADITHYYNCLQMIFISYLCVQWKQLPFNASRRIQTQLAEQ